MSQSNLQTDQARARWAAEYRAARKVRKFDQRFMPDAGLSSLFYSVNHKAYIAAIESDGYTNLWFARDNGRYGTGGKLKRHVVGPSRSLPA